MLTYILFFIWFPILIKWADILVSWASNIAFKYGIPSLVVWLTIVAFWTSAPELAINIFSALRWNTDLIMWNILWSNISNLLFILWVTACITTLHVQKTTLYKELPFSIFTVLLVLFYWFVFWKIWFFLSIVFLLLFAWFMYHNYIITKKWLLKLELWENIHIKKISLLQNFTYIIVWLIGLFIWWKWIVDGAVHIALSLGMSELIVWLTVIAIGTSLPELATSVSAALRWENDIAIWNIIGSNIFNILLVLWVTGLVTDIVIVWEMYRDIIINISAALLLFWFLYYSKNILNKIHGFIFISCFIVYISYLIFVSIFGIA